MDEKNTKEVLGKRPWKWLWGWKGRDRYLILNMGMDMERMDMKQVKDNS